METSVPRRIEAVFEVLAVGFGGWVMIILALGAFGVQAVGSLLQPVWLAVTLVAEALLTLVIIGFLDRSDPSQPGVFSLFRWSPGIIPASLAAAPLLLLTVSFTGWVFEISFPQWASEGNPLLEKIKTPWDLGAFLAAGIIAGGIREEVQRAFLLLRFERHLGGIYPGRIIWSLVFGHGHYEQGWSSTFSAAVLGLIFGGIFIWKRKPDRVSL